MTFLRRTDWVWRFTMLAGLVAVAINLFQGDIVTATWAVMAVALFTVTEFQRQDLEDSHELIQSLMRRLYANDTDRINRWLKGGHDA